MSPIKANLEHNPFIQLTIDAAIAMVDKKVLMSTVDDQPIDFLCPSCATDLRVGRSLAGQQVKCPKCGAIAVVPSGPVQVSPAPMPGATPAPQVAPTVSSEITPTPTRGPNLEKPQSDQPSQSLSGSIGLKTEEDASQIGEDTPTRQLYQQIRDEVGKIFVGQDELVLGSLVALFSGGHVLIESVPGLGKTLFVRTLGKILGCDFGRIQFTADLMPSDITGAPIFNMKSQDFEFRPGPVFTQLLLADEINRSPAKTHAALLEIMQEKRVTVDGTSHQLDLPFLVVATQNPIESEGTYNLPEAQLDRFMLKLLVDYPSEAEEARILSMHGGQKDVGIQLDEEVKTVTSPAEILKITKESADVRVDPLLINYINRIVRLTRNWPQFHMGASPRAGISLMQGARTLAAFYGRDYAVPDDVIQIALPVLRHRVQLTAEAEVEGQAVDQILEDLIRTIEVPRIK